MLEEVKKRLNQNLRNLHLPTIRQCYEEQGQLAEKNSSTYEHYLDELVELVELEVEAGRQNRVDRYLRESKLPLEKSWEAFDRKRLPRKVDVQLDTLLEPKARSSTGTRTSSRSAIRAAGRLTCCVLSDKSSSIAVIGFCSRRALFWCRNC